MRKILLVSIGPQTDMYISLCSYGQVIQIDWTGMSKSVLDDALFSASHFLSPGDVVFMQIQTAGMIDVNTVGMLKETGAFVANWSGDVRSPLPQWFKEIGAAIDITLFSNMNDVYEMRGLGLQADYMDIGFPDEIFVPHGDRYDNHPDIVFMGQNTHDIFPLSRYRQEMVKFLQDTYGDNFALYGNGWGPGIKSITDQYEEAKVYRSAKIGINLSHFNYEKYSSDRIYRITGSGCLCFSHTFKSPPFDDIITWSNFDGLKSLIDYHLEFPEILEAMQESNTTAVHQDHTWRNRAAQLFNLIKIYSWKK